MADQQLSPCPFCGRSDALVIRAGAELHEDYCECHEDSDTCYAVICDASTDAKLGGCGASGGFSESRQKAVQLWNRRVLHV